MSRSSILRSFLIIYQLFVGITLVILAIFGIKTTVSLNHEGSETMPENNTIVARQELGDINLTSQWVKRVFPFGIGENLRHLVIMFVLTRKCTIIILLIMLLVFEFCFRKLYLRAVTKVQGGFTCLLSIVAIVAIHFSKKLLKIEEPQAFLWEHAQLVMKLYVLRVVLNSGYTSHFGTTNQSPMKEMVVKSKFRKRKQYLDCIFDEAKDLLTKPLFAWMIALVFHILLSESNSLYDNDYIPDLHASLPGSNLLKLGLIVSLEVDHVLMIAALMELKWVAAMIFFVAVFSTQLHDVFKTNQTIFYKSQQQQLICVGMKIITCVLTPWVTRIIIGVSHYFLWNIMGGTSSSLFWFGQLYLHFFCVVARLRVFSHLIHFGVVSSLEGLINNGEKNSCEFELSDYIMFCEV